MMKKAISVCAMGAILVSAAMAQDVVPMSTTGSSKTVTPKQAPKIGPGHSKTPAPIKIDCCANGALTKKSGAYKVYVANKGYIFFGCEKDAHKGRKEYSAKGIKVGPIQKVSQAFKMPKVAKA